MGVFAWILGRARGSKKRRPKASRWDRVSLAPNLRVRRLEERRVLNADAAPVQALVVNAGAAAADGHADTFVVEQHDNQVRVSINGKDVSSTPISQIGSIKIQGSSDDDILIAEFKSGEPLAGFNLMFDGKGGKDSLVLSGNAPVNSIAYNFGASGSDHVDIRSGSATTKIGFAGVESVNDSLTAQSRSFDVQSGGQQVTVSDAGTANDDRSQIDLINAVDGSRESIVFKNPTNEFSLKTDASTDKPDTVILNGLDHNYHANMHVVGSSDDLLVVHGSTDIGTGNIEWSTGTVHVENSLSTRDANVDIHAADEFVITSAGTLQNDAGNTRIEASTIEQDGTIVAHGGLVQLDSGDGGMTTVRGTIDVSQADPTKSAGTVHVLGSHVGLFDNAEIDASAAVSAGTILIGGDYQGNNPAVRNSLVTYVGANVVIRADAGLAGSGGKIIVWAEEAAMVYGSFSARGGALSGDGGFVETSGKGYLDFRGVVSATASHGATGTWLLDPIDVTIKALPAPPPILPPDLSVAGLANFTALVTSSIDVAMLNAQLALVNVLVVADNIVVEDPITSVVGGKDLTLQATDTIDINASISTAGNISITGGVVNQNDNISTTSAGTVTVNAATGGITMKNDTKTMSASGAIIYHAHVDAEIELLQSSNGGAISVTADTGEIDEVSKGGDSGDVDIDTTGPVFLSGAARVGANSTLDLAGVTNLTIVTDGEFHVNTTAILTDLAVSVKPSTDNNLDYELTDNGNTTNLVLQLHDDGDDLEVTDVHLNDSGNLNLNVISRSGDIKLHAINVGGGAVRVESTVGAITDDTVAETANITTTGTATLVASTGIGGTAANDIDTAIGTLSASSTSGDIVIQETNTLIIGGTGVQTASNVSIDVVTGTLTIGTGAGEDIAATGRVTLNGAGTVSELPGSIIVSDELLLTGAGPFLLTEANDVNKLAGTVTNDVSYRDANGFSIGIGATGLSAANLTLQSGAAVTQTQAISTGGLTLLGAGPCTLENMANNAATLAGTVTNDVSYRDTNGFSIGIGASGLSAANVTLEAGAVVSQTQAITTTNLLLKGTGGYTLENAANNVARLAGTLVNNVSYRDTNGFTIGIGATGLSAANITLEAGGAVDQTQAITTTDLLLKGAGGYTLENAANDVVRLAGTVTNDVGYRDTNGFAIGIGAIGLSATNVTLEAGAAVSQTQAITTTNLLLKGTGGYTLENTANNVVRLAGTVVNDVSYRDTNGFTIGIGATGFGAANITLEAGAAVDQTQAITTTNLLLKGTGGYTLENAANNVVRLAGTITNDISYRDTDGFSIGIGATGLSAANITLEAGAAVNQTQAITTTNLLLKGASGYTLENAANNVVRLAGTMTNDVSYRDTNGFTIGIGPTGLSAANITLEAAGAVDQTQALSTTNLLLKGTGGYTLDTVTNDVDALAATVTNDLKFKDTDGFTIGIGATGLNAANVLLDSNGPVTQTQAITATGLLLKGTGAYTLNTVANDVNMLAANISNTLTFLDADDLRVGTVFGISSINTAGNDVTLKTVAGAGHDLTLADATVANGAKVTMDSGDRILDGTSTVDSDGHQTDIQASIVDLKAVNAIGTIGHVPGMNFGIADLGNESNNAGEGIELVVDTIGRAQTTAAGSTIHLIQTAAPTLASLTIAPGAIDIGGANQGQAIIQSALSINAGAINAIDLTGNDSLALLSAGTLTIPALGFNAGSGDLRMVGETDVLDTDHTLIFGADDLFFRSGGGLFGDNATLLTNVTSLTAQLGLNNLTVTETNAIKLNSVITDAGSISVTTLAGDIDVGLVRAATGTQDAIVNAAAAITELLPTDAVADIVGNTVDLTAAGGIGTTISHLEVTANFKFNAQTSVVGSSIFVDSIGSLPVGAVEAAIILGVPTGDVTLNSTSDINNFSAPDGVANVIANILNLSAASGGIGTTTILEVSTAAALNANTSGANPHILINSIGNLFVGLVNAGVGAGNVTFNSSGNINNSAAPDGAANLIGNDINLVAAVGGIGNTFPLELTANGILNADSTADSFNIFIHSIGNLRLGLVNAGTSLVPGMSNVALDSTGNIVDEPVADDSAPDIIATNLVLTADFGVGSAGNLLDTNVARFEGAGQLGGLFIAEQDSLDVGGISPLVGASANGTVEIRTLTGNLTINELVKSLAESINLDGAGLLSINDDVSATTGNVALRAGAGGVTSLTLLAGKLIKASGGQIGADTFANNGSRFTLLHNLNTKVVDPGPGDGLTLAEPTATLQVFAADIQGTNGTTSNYDIVVDWTSVLGLPASPPDITGSPVPNNDPGANLDARFVTTGIDGNSPFKFQHTYAENPNQNDAQDIDGVVSVRQIAAGTIQVTLGNLPLVAPVNVEQVGISEPFVVPVLDLPTVVPQLPVVESSSVTPPPAPIEANVETVANPVEISPTQVVEASAGYSSAGEERYYVLRIVSFDKDGNLVDDREHQIRLDDEELKAINFNPKLNRTERFDLGKLPILFGRLPDDRYRIYLIEDRTERLILDFTIQQGQPIETRDVEDTGTETGKAVADPFRDEPAVPSAPGTNQDNGGLPADAPAAKSGASNDRLPNIDQKSPAASLQLRPESSKAADTFAVRLGRASFVSRGGILVGAAALAFSRTDQWEQVIDRVMERFDRRRQSPQQRRPSKPKQPPIEISSTNSTHNSL